MQNETLVKMLSTASAFSATTMTIHQDVNDFVNAPSSDPKFPRNKVRRYLSQSPRLRLHMIYCLEGRASIEIHGVPLSSLTVLSTTTPNVFFIN